MKKFLFFSLLSSFVFFTQPQLPTLSALQDGKIFGPAQAQAGLFSKLKKAAKKVVTGVQNAVARVSTELFCDRDGAYGIAIECFKGNGANNVKHVLNLLATDSQSNVHGQAPLPYVQNRVSRIMNYESKTVQNQFFYVPGGNWDGYFPALKGTRGPVLVKNSYLNLPVVNQASMLIHESDHSRSGGHTCGATKDMYDNGAYATDIRYMKQLQRNGHPYVSKLNQASLRSAALNRTYLRICDPGARARLASEI